MRLVHTLYAQHAPSSATWGLKDLAASRMYTAGWCPRDVALTSHYLSDIAMLYASYIERDYQDQDHSSCSNEICYVNQIDESNYETKHTEKGCRCTHVEPDQGEIRKVLSKGEVPVISLTPATAPDGSQTFEVGIKSYKFLRWFVAISHVWSDGLGNSQRNSLPLCQLQAIYDLIANRWWEEMFSGLEEMFGEIETDPEISEKWQTRVHDGRVKLLSKTKKVVEKVRKRRGRPISIWIDTLCIPLEKNFRKMAIAGLKNVYSAAMFTVVLDSELQRTSSLCSPEETLMRIAVSGWMRRCWTLQEAILANIHIRVKFADGLVDLFKLVGQRTDTRDIGVDTYLVLNPKVTEYFLSFMRHAEKLSEKLDVNALNAQRIANAKKKDYSMSAYMTDEASRFFHFTKSVWTMPLQTDSSLDVVKEDKVR
jgi:hypothetical protein